MARDELKRSAALAALELVEPKLTRDAVIGIGTGSTVRFFIDALAESAHKFDAAVSSSEASTAQLRALGIPVIDLNAAPSVAVYVDGADEVDASNALIKGWRWRADAGEDHRRVGGRIHLHRRRRESR